MGFNSYGHGKWRVIYDTGHESTVEARCGVMDGEITSEVDGSEKPTKDNQSNFGTGYGYQYGSQEGIIEINMNENGGFLQQKKSWPVVNL